MPNDDTTPAQAGNNYGYENVPLTGPGSRLRAHLADLPHRTDDEERTDAAGSTETKVPTIQRIEAAEDIRAFLASVRSLHSCCFCDNTSFHGGRSAIERLALCYELDNAPEPTLADCADICEFLSSIQPVSPEKTCYGCTGDRTQCGLNIILQHVRDCIREHTATAAGGAS